jgi:hypothetical protein
MKRVRVFDGSGVRQVWDSLNSRTAERSNAHPEAPAVNAGAGDHFARKFYRQSRQRRICG